MSALEFSGQPYLPGAPSSLPSISPPSLLPPPWTVLRNGESVAAGRHYVRAWADAALSDDDTAADVELMASELITNAVLHGGGSHIRITADRHQNVVRVQVHNAPRTPTDHGRALREPEESGRGLFIVAALATSWGLTQDPSGTTGWFKLATS